MTAGPIEIFLRERATGPGSLEGHIGRTGCAIWAGDAPPVLLIGRGPGRVSHRPDKHRPHLRRPVRLSVLVGTDDVVSLLLRGHGVPGVGRVDLVAGPTE